VLLVVAVGTEELEIFFVIMRAVSVAMMHVKDPGLCIPAALAVAASGLDEAKLD
jgi:hypothetical protein